MKKPDYNLDQQIGYLLRLAYQRHSTIFQRHMLSDLTPTQFSALIRIHEEKSCSQNLLGRMVSVDVATIKGVIGRLKKKGLIDLNEDPTDKRRTLISLTPEAVELMNGFKTTGSIISEETLRPLTASERNRLLQLLTRIT